MGFDQPWHWLIVIALAVLLFGGYKKLPDASRSLGRSLRIFKTEIKGMSEDDRARDEAAAPATPAEVVPPAPVSAPASAPVPPAPPVTEQPPAAQPASTTTSSGEQA